MGGGGGGRKRGTGPPTRSQRRGLKNITLGTCARKLNIGEESAGCPTVEASQFILPAIGAIICLNGGPEMGP